MSKEQFFTPLEVKFSGGDSDVMTFSGYGARFGNVDSYGDVIAQGAFEKTLKEAKSVGPWPAMLLQHGSFLGGDDNMPVGVWTDLYEDEKGLYVEGRLADTQRGRDTYTLLKMKPRPAINGMSIGFQPIDWDPPQKPNGPRRTLKEVRLAEVSLVTFPANSKARVEAVKSTPDDIREFERFLRDVGGFSHAKAKAIAVNGFKAAEPREEDGADLAEILRKNIEILKTRKES